MNETETETSHSLVRFCAKQILCKFLLVHSEPTYASLTACGGHHIFLDQGRNVLCSDALDRTDDNL